MSVGRRKVRLEDTASWIFNRMADVYASRPAYPSELVSALAEIAARTGGSIADLGAGIGHLALPLAERGFAVTAIEPARVMLDVLEHSAHERGLELCALHATAEALPLDSASVGLVLVADALHFLDKELTAAEIARVLTPRGALAVVTSEFTPTPFMRHLVELMQAAAPRRPRDVTPSVEQLAAIAKVRLGPARQFVDETPVDRATLERILRSISFIGPAMNAERFAAFRERVHALSDAPVWARTFTLRAGQRGGAGRRRALEALGA